MKYITRDEIKKALFDWQNSKINDVELYAWANKKYDEAMLDKSDFEDYEGDDNSVSMEVLHCLECMNMNLVIEEDIPALIEFLETPVGSYKIGLEKWENYNKRIDYAKRKKELKENPLYSKYCNE